MTATIHPFSVRASQHVYLDRLDGTPWLGKCFNDAAPDAAWSWIRDCVATELSCSVDSVGHLEDADTVTVDGLPVYHVRIEPQTIWIAGRRAIITGEWVDDREMGWNYRFVGEDKSHWIRAGDARLGRRQTAAEIVALSQI